ncbi:hypothetical protein [Clostridium mediterraneense]|uniref:hypothetical protein n=1 Tax=Clostridium mediterraneense TaxID=1805472 RepID=UPI00082DD6BA|nr:hypothetical protein [Clostridium mediterraneense]
MVIIKNQKKIIFILSLSISLFFIGSIIKNYLIHLDCHKSDYKGFAKTHEASLLEQSLNEHWERTFSAKSSSKLRKELRQLLKCQQKVISKIKSTEDTELKELLVNYEKGIKKSLKNLKINSKILFEDKAELNTRVLKETDILFLKSLDKINDTYGMNMYEDYTAFIKYLLYSYNKSPDTYDSFIPTSNSYYYFDRNIYFY